MLTVACVETGNYLGRGEDYVRRLKMAVEQHLTVPHRFVCVTDRPKEGVECIKARFTSWWEKLRLFELFHGRVLFLDLDTAIVGSIDHVARYDGAFATLRDFWFPKGLGPAVMLFDERAKVFWDEWAAAGYPTEGHGDQWWIQTCRGKLQVDILQEMFPGTFVSYKEHCTKAGRRWSDPADQLTPPHQASVVCFHGRPRPHELGGWVRDYMEEAHGLVG